MKAALKADPHFFQGWLRLSRILFETENYPEAVQVGQAAEQFDPLQADFRAIQSHMQAQAFGQAEQVAKQMLLKQPGHPRAVFTLAHVAGLKNYPEGQVAALQHGIEMSPANLVLRSRLVAAQDLAGDYQGAIESARTLVKTQESFTSLWTLVSVLLRHGKNEELLDVCERARIRSDGDPAKLSEVELVRGQILRVMGWRDDSVAAYRACLEHNPANAGARWALADMKTYAFTDADRAAVEALLARFHCFPLHDPLTVRKFRLLLSFIIAFLPLLLKVIKIHCIPVFCTLLLLLDLLDTWHFLILLRFRLAVLFRYCKKQK